MNICDNCKKEFSNLNNYSYGLKKGKFFLYRLCPDCAKNLTEKEKDKLILKTTLK